MSFPSRTRLLAALVVVSVAALPGCTTTQSTKAKALKPTTAATTAGSVSACQNLTVRAFSVPTGKRVDPNAGKALATDVQRRLANDFGTLFD
ncbi:MAG: hypothetical protein ACREO3_06395 [Arenimonas sp.]